MPNFRLSSGTTARLSQPIGISNQGLGQFAQAKLDAVVDRQVAKHLQALKTNGSDLHFWLRKTTGAICTCQGLNSRGELRSDPISGPERFNGFSTNVPQGDVSIVQTRGRRQPRPQQNNGIKVPESIDDSMFSGREDGRNELMGRFVDEATDDELARFVTNGTSDTILGSDKKPCGICFGTGYTQGYSLINGERIVLDNSSDSSPQLSKCIVDFEATPNAFVLNNIGSMVIWPVELPRWTTGWLVVVPRNNLQKARGVIIERSLDNGVSWQAFDQTDMELNSDDPKSWLVRARRADSLGDDDDSRLTHIEMICTTAPPIVGQCAALNIDVNYNIDSPIVQTNFEIAGVIPELSRESVFTDSKYKMVWKVTSVTQHRLARGQVWGYTISARTVHPNEILWALRTEFDPEISVSYRGLEIIQGGLSNDPLDLENEHVLGSE